VALTIGIVVVATAPASASVAGAVSAWGANAYGELGNGTTTDASSPVTTNRSGGATVIAAGARHSLAIYADGSVRAWGRNGSGELGNGTTTNSSVPVQVRGLGAGSGVIAVSGGAPPITATSVSGAGHSLALKSNGQVLSWGNNNSGQIGNGTSSTTVNQLVPVQPTGLGAGSGVVRIAAGGSHSLALTSGGVKAWGQNQSGQLGNGAAPTDSSTPVNVTGLGPGSGVVRIAAGAAFSLALKSDGTVLAWGRNASGQLGNGAAPTDSSTPVAVTGLGAGSGVVGIAAGDAFAVAWKSDGTVLAWGNNASGQLGNGAAPTDSSTPVPVTGLGSGSGVVQVAIGFSHAIARKSDGTLLAWGRNVSGQLGDGTTTQHDTPETLTLISGVSAVAAGGSHSMALRMVTSSPTISIGDKSVLEGDSGTRTITFPVALSEPATTTVTVHYAVSASGTGSGFATGANAAGSGVDFLTSSGTISFIPSGTSGNTPVIATVSVTVRSDVTVEPAEKFKVVLSSPSGGGFTLKRATATATILNDDAHTGITVGVGDGSIMEGNIGAGRQITFPVTLSKPATTTVSLHYAFAPITATVDRDYTGTMSGTVTFARSTTTGVTPTLQNLTINTSADLVTEPNETFRLTLSGTPPSGVSILRASSTGTILNDDAP
jgi:alpha-tubulin suppressor-like RCC1 family protein